MILEHIAFQSLSLIIKEKLNQMVYLKGMLWSENIITLSEQHVSVNTTQVAVFGPSKNSFSIS